VPEILPVEVPAIQAAEPSVAKAQSTISNFESFHRRTPVAETKRSSSASRGHSSVGASATVPAKLSRPSSQRRSAQLVSLTSDRKRAAESNKENLTYNSDKKVSLKEPAKKVPSVKSANGAASARTFPETKRIKNNSAVAVSESALPLAETVVARISSASCPKTLTKPQAPKFSVLRARPQILSSAELEKQRIEETAQKLKELAKLNQLNAKLFLDKPAAAALAPAVKSSTIPEPFQFAVLSGRHTVTPAVHSKEIVVVPLEKLRENGITKVQPFSFSSEKRSRTPRKDSDSDAVSEKSVKELDTSSNNTIAAHKPFTLTRPASPKLATSARVLPTTSSKRVRSASWRSSWLTKRSLRPCLSIQRFLQALVTWVSLASPNPR